MARAKTKPRAVLVIGVGNACRGDDAVGLLVARALRDRNRGQFRVLQCEGDALALMELWEGADEVILIDAIQAGGQPGAVYRFDTSAGEVAYDSLRPSTHSLSIGEAIELARILKRLPPRLIIYGIEARDFTAGHELSSSVQQVLPDVVGRIWEETLASETETADAHRSSEQ